MKASAVPSNQFPLPFAYSGSKNSIPEASQIAINPGAASLTDGFPPLTRTALSAGGVPPSGLDFNGILFELSLAAQWSNAGGMYAYDSTFASAVSGYPKGAVLLMASGDGLWYSNVDDNTTDPDAGVSSNWTPILPDRVTTVTANTTLTIANGGLVLVDATAGNIVITLAAANALAALGFVFIRTDTTANTVTIQRAGTDTIQGGTSLSLLSNSPISLQSDGVSTYYSNAPAITTSSIQPIDASVASSALTLTLNPTVLDFRDATLGSGVVNKRVIDAAISLNISSGSTLGTVSGVQSRIIVVAIDNAGTIELAAVNEDCGFSLDETGVISTTAEGGAGTADSATTVYSQTARSSVPYRVVGFVESTQATAGTWATAPSTIQGFGGQALAAMASIGYGQTWQDVSASRALGTTYYNLTGRPIEVGVVLVQTSGATYVQLNAFVGGLQLYGTNNDVGSAANQTTNATFIVPPGSSYEVSGANATIKNWTELR